MIYETAPAKINFTLDTLLKEMMVIMKLKCMMTTVDLNDRLSFEKRTDNKIVVDIEHNYVPNDNKTLRIKQLI